MSVCLEPVDIPAGVEPDAIGRVQRRERELNGKICGTSRRQEGSGGSPCAPEGMVNWGEDQMLGWLQRAEDWTERRPEEFVEGSWVGMVEKKGRRDCREALEA